MTKQFQPISGEDAKEIASTTTGGLEKVSKAKKILRATGKNPELEGLLDGIQGDFDAIRGLAGVEPEDERGPEDPGFPGIA